jgi:hypothetical protein
VSASEEWIRDLSSRHRRGYGLAHHWSERRAVARRAFTARRSAA